VETVIKAKTIHYGMEGTTIYTQDKESYFIPLQKRNLKAMVKKFHRVKLRINYHTLQGTGFKVIDEVQKNKGGKQ